MPDKDQNLWRIVAIVVTIQAAMSGIFIVAIARFSDRLFEFIERIVSIEKDVARIQENIDPLRGRKAKEISEEISEAHDKPKNK